MTRNAKEQAHELIDQLPSSASWEDVLYRLAVRGAVEKGLADEKAGRLTNVKDVRREFEDKWKSNSRMLPEDNSKTSTSSSPKTNRKMRPG